MDTLVAFNANQILNYWCSGNIPRRWGNAHINICPYQVFATSDGHLILAVGNDSQDTEALTAGSARASSPLRSCTRMSASSR